MRRYAVMPWWYSTLANCKRTLRRSSALSHSLSPSLTLGGPWAACTDKGSANKRSQNKTQTQLSSVAVLSQEHLGKVAKNLSPSSKLCRELSNKLNNLCNPRRRRVGLKTITKRNSEQPKRFTTTATNLQHGFHQGVASPYSPSSTLTHFSGRRKLLVAQHLRLQLETPTPVAARLVASFPATH